MEKEFNARCPNCGTEFVTEETGGKVMCPGCGEECSAVQAKKYYSTIHATKGEFKEAHGEEYHKEMMILDEVYGYLRLGDFENAEKKVYEALELTDSDYKVFMAMVAVYYILKAVGLSEGAMIRVALVLVYSASSGIQFYIAKGFFDTIPKTIDEAAMIDGATKWQVFTKITIPLSKPIIVYTILTSFIAPWVDFIFARVICRANAKYYTVAIGLWQMLEKEYVDVWYTRFAAGAVLISIPIAALFMIMQRCYNESMTGAVKG